MPLPASAAVFNLASDLTAFEPNTVLHSFYRRATNFELYAQDLAALSRIRSVVTPASASAIERVYIEGEEDAGPWLKGARIAKSAATAPAESPLWSRSDYEWPVVGDDFSLFAFPGGLLPETGVIVTTVVPEKGAVARIPRSLGTVVTMIPKVESVALAGGALTAVDYESTSAENGLTRPFCLTASDVDLGLLPPEDQDGDPIAITALPTIELSFAYYGSEDGADVGLTAATADFPSAFRAVRADTLPSGAARRWDPETQTVTVTPGTDPAAGAAHEMTLWSELFLDKAGAEDVKKIRVQAVFQSDSTSLRSATVIWFKKDC
jgi:hypothetical protein